MSDQFTLDVVQAAEIKHAVVRNGGTKADLKALSSGDMFAKIIPVLRGYGQVVVNFPQLLGEVAFSGVRRFVAKNHFKENTSRNTKVWVAFIGEAFRNFFLGKIEVILPEGVLHYWKLPYPSIDPPIISSLGGEEKVETYLAEVHYLMSLQSNGEEGVLLKNGCANIFYVRDTSGVLRVVRLCWGKDGWYVDALEVSDPGEWQDGCRVFSRK